MNGRIEPSKSNALLSLTSVAMSEDAWTLYGFRDASGLQRGWTALRSNPQLAAQLDAHAPAVVTALAASCDPDAAFFLFQRWVEAGGIAASSDWHRPEFLRALCALFAATPALSTHFTRFPARTQPVLQPVVDRKIAGGAAWQWTISEAMKGAEGWNAQLAALRRTRVECMLQIAALDLANVSPLLDTVRALSDLADACAETALHIAAEKLHPRIGAPPPAKADAPRRERPRFVIFALGKLGGRELNYSSDIDLVYLFSGRGETTGGTRSVPLRDYYNALGAEVVSALDKVTEDGRVYRVDMRLRPHGSAGALVRSLEETQNYFQTEGRTWERQAWLKGRPIAGDLDLGEDLLAAMDPFIFQRYLTLESIGDIQALKRQIELSVARRGESKDEVKLGHGGIRDVEFTVQFLQLLYGSEHLGVRGGNTLRALHALRREGLLADLESDHLANAYVFLRHIEHRLQLHGDLQVHKLPADIAVRRRIARSLGFVDQSAAGGLAEMQAHDAFEAQRVRHTTRVRNVFQKLFANLFRESQGPEGEISDQLLAPQPDLARLSELAAQFGYSDADGAARELIDLSRDRVILTAPSRTRKIFAAIAPALLKAIAATGEPNEALRRFSRIAGSLGAKAIFYQMLNENPWLLKMTAELSAWSEYLTGILVANPGLFDELVDSLQTGQTKTAAELEAELARIAGPQVGVSKGDIGDTLRAYRSAELLRIGVRDLFHSAPVEQTQSELSDLAQALLRTQLTHSLIMQQLKRGSPHDTQGQPVGFAVLALGKFGGREMNYGSDLDVLYFYGSDGRTEQNQPAVSYFAELAQEMTRTMAASTALGRLYELDARLRPNGNKGPLALSLDDFKRYWQEGQLADWERLALTRVRYVAGDERVAERALHLIRSAVYSPLKDTSNLGREVASMRARLQETAEADDLKRGKGGIMDIEFIAQYLQLLHGPALPPVRQANTENALKAMMKFKKLSAEDGKVLSEAYDFLRMLENRVRIVQGLSAHTLPNKPEALEKLALRVGYTNEAGKTAGAILMEDYDRHSTAVRGVFTRVVGEVKLS